MESIPKSIPDIMNYKMHANSQSLYHTPPEFSVYIVNLMLKWIQKNGGVKAIEERNHQKANLVYNIIDKSGGFYNGLARLESRSKMNVTFSIFNEEIEKLFIQEAEKNGFIGVKGHKETGHLRVSIYNAVTYEQCQALTDFMIDFQNRFG